MSKSNKFKVGDIVRRTVKSSRPEHYGRMGVDYEVLGLTATGIVVTTAAGAADPDSFELVTTDNNNLETTAMTTSKFTETVTTTKTTIKEVVDGCLSNHALMSVTPSPEAGVISLVVGASHSDEYKSLFDKSALQELINELQAVHDAMENN
tara:strand:+ start:59 stop:511 length:453 start_codon:yes stop_codon:yes gene_type:complete